MSEMNIQEKIRHIRTVSLPNFLGVKKISQRAFADIISGVAVKVTGIKFECSLRDVQRWEYGENGPSLVPAKAIDAIWERTKKSKAKKDAEKMPWFVAQSKDKVGSIVEALISETAKA